MECVMKKRVDALVRCYVFSFLMLFLGLSYAIWGMRYAHEILLRVQIDQCKMQCDHKLENRVDELEKSLRH